jgi:tetratricopeptide (TPR) repeat protein
MPTNLLLTAVCLVAAALAFPAPVLGEQDCVKAEFFTGQAIYAQDQSRARELCLAAIALCPGAIRPYELLGNIERKAGRRAAAIEHFTKAVELGSRNYKLYHLLAQLFFEEQRLDDAHRAVAKCLSLRPEYFPARELRAKIEAAADREGPVLSMLEPAAVRGVRLIVPHATLTIRGVATDKSGVAWVKVNGGQAPLEDDGRFLLDVPLQQGGNFITVEACDRLGNLSRLAIAVEGAPRQAEPAGEASSLYGRSFAVVIGINRYEKWPPLEFAVADAAAVERRLRETGFEEVTTILDGQATQGRILTELFHNLPARVGPDDRVLFYFAGHGQTEDLAGGGRRGYIIPVDADTAGYAASSISMEQLRSLTGRIRAKHILFVMDSCYAGLGLSRSAGLAPDVPGFLRKVAALRAVQIVTAGGGGEQAQESGGHGLFTGFFLKALDGAADIDHDGVVTATELGAYLRPAVSAASGQSQTPLFGRLEGEGDFLFFVRP